MKTEIYCQGCYEVRITLQHMFRLCTKCYADKYLKDNEGKDIDDGKRQGE